MEPKDFTEFENKIGISFTNKDLLTQAFLHRSYLNENREIEMGHNERLEFLGDAVLELVTTEFLFHKYPSKPEGELTAYRAALVNTQSISMAAERLNVNKYLLLSRGEAKDIGRARQYILANTFEAIIGAIYLDQGYDVATRFISENLLPTIDDIVRKRLWQDAKSYFQEKAQEAYGHTPTYDVVRESGPDHDKTFEVVVRVGPESKATGSGHSKQEAEQSAARAALEAAGWVGK
ncbi:MAG: ribonuclease III [bacterium]|nr:ribonuclease III [bacterium]